MSEQELRAEIARLQAEVDRLKPKRHRKPARTQRRHESPVRRVNPSGKVVWRARPTDRHGVKRALGTFAYKRDAQRAMDEFYDREYGTAPAAENEDTVRGYLEHWLRRHPRAAKTEKAYYGRVKRACEIPLDGRPFGDFLMTELRPRECADLVDRMFRVEGRAAAGVSAVVQTLKAMWSDAVRDSVATFNPWREVRLRSNDPRVQKPPRAASVWSWEQMHELARAALEPNDHRKCTVLPHYEAMCRTLADCGLRLGEMLGAERTGLAADGRCGVVGCPAEGVPHLHVDGKTGPRVAPVPDGLLAVLRGLPPRIDSRLLFPSHRGGPMDARQFYREVWYPARNGVVGMERAVPHDFRHTYVSRLRAAGVNAADLAQMAGHTEQTATRVYSHPLGQSFEQVRRAVG